ncbi:MAG: hypothetical protein AAFR14_08940, partial [Bacteroidota bacterium]
ILPSVRSTGYRNYTGTGQSTGLELSLGYTGRQYQGFLAYTLSKSTERYDEINRGQSFSAQQDRRHQLSFAQSYNFGDWYMSSQISFASGRPYIDLDKLDQDNDRRDLDLRSSQSVLPDYVRVDLGVGYEWTWDDHRLGLALSLVNALDRENVTYIQYTFALPGRDGGQLDRGSTLGNASNLLDRTLNLTVSYRFN